MDGQLEREIIQKIAILETHMQTVLEYMKTINQRPAKFTTTDKLKLGGLIATITALINLVSVLVQKGVL